MISATQMQAIRSTAARVIEECFATVIVIAGHSVPAARHRATSGGTHEMAGILPTADVSWRVRRDVLPPGVAIQPERTTIEEGEAKYRVERVHDPIGDPCVIIEARAL